MYGPKKLTRYKEEIKYTARLQKKMEKVTLSHDRIGKRINNNTVGPFGEEKLNDNIHRIVKICDCS